MPGRIHDPAVIYPSPASPLVNMKTALPADASASTKLSKPRLCLTAKHMRGSQSVQSPNPVPDREIDRYLLRAIMIVFFFLASLNQKPYYAASSRPDGREVRLLDILEVVAAIWPFGLSAVILDGQESVLLAARDRVQRVVLRASQ
jgi:hypothetical protein